MPYDDTSSKLRWEAPEAVALTDRNSRADVADVAMRNGIPVGSESPN